MTINVIANNIGEVSAEHLEAIPVRLLWRIWRFLEARFATRAHGDAFYLFVRL